MTNYSNREQAHAEAMLRGADCAKCPLYGCQRGPVMPEIRPGKKLLVITESPSKDDVRAGAHLVDKAGQEFAQGLREGGYVREDVSITSVVLCQPPPGWNLEDLLGAVTKKNKQLTQELVTAKQRGETAAVPEMLQSPVVACAGRLTRDVADSRAATFLTLGGKALQSVAHAYDIPFAREPNAQGQFISNVSEQAGAPVQLPDGKILCSSWHPWFGMSDKRHLLPLIRKYIARAAEIAQRGRVNWAWVPDESCPSTFADHLAFIERLIAERAVVVCDIETDGIALSKDTAIRCIGLGSFLRLQPGQVANAVDKIISPPGYTYVTSSVPLVTRTGSQWWPAEHREALLEALRRLFRLNRCMFHNGLFDTAVMKAHGLWPELQTWADTMVAHHCTRWTDHRHRLSDLGRQYTEAPLWKKMVDHKEAEGDVGDDILHRYNRYDVQVTAVAGLEIFKELQSDDTFAQYQTDEKLAPIARDMSMRGLWIDERERGRLSLAYNALEFGLIKKWVKLVGAPINPRSGAQVAEWLFGKNGLTPPLATDGEEFEDGDDPAVSIPALFTLQDQGLPPHVAEAVQCLLDIKAVSKARTSYVDFKHRMESAGGSEVPAVHAGRWNFKNTKRGARMQVKWEEALPKRTAASRLFANWQLHVVPCVALDTWILTGDGPRQIGKLPGFPSEARAVRAPADPLFLSDGRETRVVGGLVNSGVCDSVDVTTALGFSLTGTPHHEVQAAPRGAKFNKHARRERDRARSCLPVAPLPEWRRLDKLVPGDYVRVPIGAQVWSTQVPLLRVRDYAPQGNRFNSAIELPRAVSEELARFVGIYNADGSLHDGNGSFAIRVTNAKPQHRGMIVDTMTACFGENRVAVRADAISVTSIALQQWVEDIGLGRRIENKGAPDWILASPWRVVREYIKGCAVDSHFTVTAGITPVWVYTGSKRLAQEMQMLLLNHGIPASLRDRRRPGHELTWQCLVSGAADVAELCKITGQTPPVATREAGYARPKYLRRGNDLWLRVKTVQAGAQIPMRDVMVDTTNAFWSNGFVSHNSGRWSSSPNVQNIPKKIWELHNADTGKSEAQYGRKMFVCPPGHVMVQADYEQIELRVYAAVTGDGYSIAALDQNLDPHLLAAAIITAPTDEGVMEQFALLRDWRAGKGTPAQKKLAEFYRGAAKTVRYLKNYGGGGEKLYDSMRTLRNKTTNKRLFSELNGATGKKLVAEWEKRWDARQTETAAWHRSVGAAVRRYEYTQSPIGDKRKRYFPDGPSKVNAPPNHIIQASAAYICNQAMLKLAEAIPFGSWSEETGICLQVHDYIAMYVPQERALEAAEILKRCMYYEMEYEGGVMPFPATPIISRNWADGDEQIPWEQDPWDTW